MSTDPTHEARRLLAAATASDGPPVPYVELDCSTKPCWGAAVVSFEDGDAKLLKATPRLLRSLADEVERMRANTPWEDVDLSTVIAVDMGDDIYGPCDDGWHCLGDDGHIPFRDVDDVVETYGKQPQWFRDTEGWHRVAEV